MLLWGGKQVWEDKDGDDSTCYSATSLPQLPQATATNGHRLSTALAAESESRSKKQVTSKNTLPSAGVVETNARRLVLSPILRDLELSEKQIRYIESVFDPLLSPLAVEAVTQMPGNLEGFILQWLLGHLNVPKSLSAPLMSFLKAPVARTPSPRDMEASDLFGDPDNRASDDTDTRVRTSLQSDLFPTLTQDSQNAHVPLTPVPPVQRPSGSPPPRHTPTPPCEEIQARQAEPQEEEDEEGGDKFEDLQCERKPTRRRTDPPCNTNAGLRPSIMKSRTHQELGGDMSPTRRPSILKKASTVSLEQEAPAARRVSMAVVEEPTGRRTSNASVGRKSRARAVSIFEPPPEIPKNEIVEMIKNHDLFQGLDDDEIQLLAVSAKVKSFQPDEEIISFGEKLRELHMIWSGEGRVSVPKQVGTLGKGDSFGEHALAKRHLASTTTVSCQTGDTRLTTLSLTYEDLSKLDLMRKLRRAWHQSSKHSKYIGRCNTRKVDRGGTVAKTDGTRRRDNRLDSCVDRDKMKRIPKSKEDQELLRLAIHMNTHLMEWLQLSEKQVDTMVDLMRLEEFEPDQEVTRKGEQGNTFYIVQDGMLEIVTNNRQTEMSHAARFRSGDSFGELALLYNCPRKATIRACRKCSLWVLTRSQFCLVMKLKSDSRIREYEELINTVQLLAERLTAEEKEMLADTLEEVFFVKGEEVVKQGEEGDTFFVIFEGECEVKVNGVARGTLQKGAYFGERALLNKEPRAATVVVASETATLLALDGTSFDLILGGALEGTDPQAWTGRGKENEEAQSSEPVLHTRMLQHRSSLDLIRQMVAKQVVRKATRNYVPKDRLEFVGVLGHGSFASVSLHREQSTGRYYALKALSKKSIMEQKMKHMVLNEKRTMMMLDSDFAVFLHCTYSCPGFLYFLLEPALGGELFQVFSEHEEFFGSDQHAKFYAICCSLGLEHLHSRRIIYRDLKLENVLLYSDGYACLTDLGLAKVVIGKTYTVCGTADYFAPETLKRVGHNRAVDWWALGVMIFVMMSGRSPFDAEDVMQIYKNIVKGFKKETFPSDFAPDLVEMIKGLCRKKPEERIPMSPKGMKDLQSQTWLSGIGWAAIEKRTWRAPFQPPELDVEELAKRALPEDAPPLPHLGYDPDEYSEFMDNDFEEEF